MVYLFQVAIVLILIILERINTKWATTKINNGDVYDVGAFKLHELHGDKAIKMYKINIYCARVMVVITILSIIYIDK
jgi:hypothetical protein